MGIPRERIEEQQEDLAEDSKEAAERRCKLYFLLEKVADAERLYATEEEVENRLKEMARRRETTFAKLKSQLESSGRISDVRHELREEKTMQFLKEKAKTK
jgi:trigger factor